MYDGDGRLDWFVTSIYDTSNGTGGGWGVSGNRLYRNQGARSFSDATDHAGVRNGDWGWGTVFFDYDNDGDLDLVMTNGVNFPVGPGEESFHADRMRLWRNNGDGTFDEVSELEGITDTGSGKGLLTWDYDRDGDLDLFVVNNGASPVLYRNDSPGNNAWLHVDLVGTLSNPTGIGARVRVVAGPTTQIREANCGSGLAKGD